MLDTIIVGGGPAGLSAAIYAQRALLDNVVIEKDYMGMGQIVSTERVDNYPGLYGENGYDLAEKFHKHAESLGAEFLENNVLKIEKTDKGWKIFLDNEKVLESKTIIYCGGTNHRKLDIKGEQEFSARGISFCAVCDGMFYKDKVTAVIGGGDTALSDALYLSKIAKKVYIIHRRDKFRANNRLQQQVKNTANIELILNATPCEFIGEKLLTGIKYIQQGEEKLLECNGAFLAVGNIPNTEILNGLVDLDKNGYIIADETGKTSAEGFFAAGDVRTKKLRQVITAASDGANCVESVEEYLQTI